MQVYGFSYTISTLQVRRCDVSTPPTPIATPLELVGTPGMFCSGFDHGAILWGLIMLSGAVCEGQDAVFPHVRER